MPTCAKLQAWAAEVKARDGNRCQKCGAADVYLHAHHIKPKQSHPDLKFDINNGETLCERCHKKAHRLLKTPVCIRDMAQRWRQ